MILTKSIVTLFHDWKKGSKKNIKCYLCVSPNLNLNNLRCSVTSLHPHLDYIKKNNNN